MFYFVWVERLFYRGIHRVIRWLKRVITARKLGSSDESIIPCFTAEGQDLRGCELLEVMVGEELKSASFLHGAASWNPNPDLGARRMSAFVFLSKHSDRDEGQVCFLLCLYFPGLWRLLLSPLPWPGSGSEEWSSPAVLATMTCCPVTTE